MNPDERLRWTLKYMEKIHPGLTLNFEGGTSFSWDHDPFALGSWAYYAPGEMATFYPHVSRPEGRIHFAGEHTSADEASPLHCSLSRCWGRSAIRPIWPCFPSGDITRPVLRRCSRSLRRTSLSVWWVMD